MTSKEDVLKFVVHLSLVCAASSLLENCSLASIFRAVFRWSNDEGLKLISVYWNVRGLRPECSEHLLLCIWKVLWLLYKNVLNTSLKLIHSIYRSNVCKRFTFYNCTYWNSSAWFRGFFYMKCSVLLLFALSMSALHMNIVA